MLIKTKIASIIFKFDDFQHYATDFWSWKLDTFRYDDECIYNSIVINQSLFNHKKLETGKYLCLHKEPSGFFFRQVFDIADDNLIFELTDANTKENKLVYNVYKWKEITLLRDNSNTAGMAAFEYLAQIMPGVFLKHHLLSIHSSLIEYNGYSFAICANSGVGKTTRARLWRDHKNALILNGDRTVCKRTEEGWTSYGTPWSGTSGEQINRSAPLRAMVVLQRADENKVTRLSPAEALPLLLPHLLYPEWDEELVNIAFDEFDHLLSEVPVFLLQSLPDAGSVEVLEQALEELS